MKKGILGKGLFSFLVLVILGSVVGYSATTTVKRAQRDTSPSGDKDIMLQTGESWGEDANGIYHPIKTASNSTAGTPQPLEISGSSSITNSNANATQALASGALSLTSNFTSAPASISIALHANTPITQTVTVTKISTLGAAYNTVIDTASLVANTDVFWNNKVNFVTGDQVNIACTNTGTPSANVSATITGGSI